MGELAKDELELEAREHKGEDVALNYDATPMNDDVAIVVSRICREDFTLEHRLVAVKRFARSLKSVHWQNVITTTLMDLSVPRPKFKVGLSDGCNVMVNVGTSLSQVYESFIFLLCHPHVWQKIPGKFHLQLLDNTLHCWRAVFKNSFAARAIFEEITGEKWNRGHKIRWNAKQDQAQQVARTFMSLQSINDELKAEKLCTETQPKLERILTGQLHLYSDFSLQLAARVDGGAHFVRITKLLEGDGFLAPFVVRYTLEVKKFIQEVMQAADPCLALPNVFALLRKAPDHVDTRKLWGVVKSWLKPGFDYVWKVMGGGQADEDGGHYSLDIYRVARLCHPSQATTLLEENKVIDFEKLLSGTDVRRFFGDTLCNSLLEDVDKLLMCHRAHIAKFLQPDELLEHWRKHGSEMGSWAAAARKLVLCQPNSCLAERAGSIVRSRISDQQGSMMEETFETTCKLAFRYAEAREAKKKRDDSRCGTKIPEVSEGAVTALSDQCRSVGARSCPKMN
jgi:hypothetical protein